MVPELLGLGVLGYSDPLGLGVPDCLLLGVLGVPWRGWDNNLGGPVVNARFQRTTWGARATLF